LLTVEAAAIVTPARVMNLDVDVFVRETHGHARTPSSGHFFTNAQRRNCFIFVSFPLIFRVTDLREQIQLLLDRLAFLRSTCSPT